MSCNTFIDPLQHNPAATGSLNYITADIETADKIIGIIPANRMIQRIHIDVLEPYDIPGMIAIGDQSVSARLWRFGNDLTKDQIYTKLMNYRYSLPTQIKWHFETAATTGKATITIHYS